MKMGYRSDVALAISKGGWEELATLLDGQHAAFSVDDCNSIIDFLDQADDHSVDSSSGDNLLQWHYIKSAADDAALLFDKALHLIDMTHWYLYDLGEDGAEDINGDYPDNPFNICITRNLSANEGDVSMAGKKCGISRPLQYVILTPTECPSWTAAVVPPPVDNYICSCCGNDKLNDITDKSCWKCGEVIKAAINPCVIF
jgi:hypothetical protein